MLRRPPRSTRPATLFPDATLFRSRRACKRRERVRSDHAPERPRAVAAFHDRGDDALAHAGAAPALVDDQDALRARRLFADEAVVARDRKRVLEGKRVSVCVNFGGRRIIKKKIPRYILIFTTISFSSPYLSLFH